MIIEVGENKAKIQNECNMSKAKKKIQQYLTSLEAEHWTSNLIIGTSLLLFIFGFEIVSHCPFSPNTWCLQRKVLSSTKVYGFPLWSRLRHIVHDTQFCTIWQLLCIMEISFLQKSVEFESSNSCLTLLCFRREVVSGCETETRIGLHKRFMFSIFLSTHLQIQSYCGLFCTLQNES